MTPQVFGLLMFLIAAGGFGILMLVGHFRLKHMAKQQPPPHPITKPSPPPRPQEPVMSVTNQPQQHRQPDQDRQAEARPELWASPIFETTINDYHEARKQDQHLNSLVMQHIDLGRDPWQVKSWNEAANVAANVLGSDNDGRPASGLLIMVRLLTAISQPVAAGSGSRNNSSPGSTYCVQVGQNRIRCQTEAAMQGLTRSLNAKTFTALLDVRRNILECIQNRIVPKVEQGFLVYIDQNHCVYAVTQRDADRIAGALNQVYRNEVQPYRAKLEDDIAYWASQELKEMLPLMDHPEVVKA